MTIKAQESLIFYISLVGDQLKNQGVLAHRRYDIEGYRRFLFADDELDEQIDFIIDYERTKHPDAITKIKKYKLTMPEGLSYSESEDHFNRLFSHYQMEAIEHFEARITNWKINLGVCKRRRSF